MTAFRSTRRQQRGVVMFMALILLMILTLLGVALARTQTVEERLAQNDRNHQLALQTAEAALRAGYQDLTDGVYTDFSGATAGLNTVANELGTTGTTIGYNSTWTTPGVNTIIYNGAPLPGSPIVANAQFVIEQLPAVVPPGCQASNAGSYLNGPTTVYRVTAHSAGGDGTASATVQTIHVGSC